MLRQAAMTNDVTGSLASLFQTPVLPRRLQRYAEKVATRVMTTILGEDTLDVPMLVGYKETAYYRERDRHADKIIDLNCT